MKKNIWIILMLSIIICGCSAGTKTIDEATSLNVSEINGGSSENLPEEVTDKNVEQVTEETTEDEHAKKPDEEKMYNDLIEQQCDTLHFTGEIDKITIPIVEMNLDRAKEDGDKYIAYWIVKLGNDYYDATMTYCLTYEFYDIGGWKLNTCTEENRSIVSISPDDSIIQEQIKKKSVANGWGEADALNLSEYQLMPMEKEYTWGCTYLKKDARQYADAYYADTIICTFDNEQGWSFGTLQSTFMYDDWSKIVGKKFYTGIQDNSYFYIEVLDFDTFSMSVQCKVSGHVDGKYSYAMGKSVYDYEDTIVDNLELFQDSHTYYYRKCAFDESERLYDSYHSWDFEYNGQVISESAISINWNCDYGIVLFKGGNVFFDETLQEIN